MKRVLSFILITFLFFINCGVDAVSVISVNSTSEFIEAIKSDTVIKLDSDLNFDEKVAINKNISLDLNNHTITFTKNKRFEVKGGKFEINGKGTIKEVMPWTAPVVVVGSLDVNAKNYSSLIVGENVTLEGYYGTFVTINLDSNKISHAHGVTVDIYGKLIGLTDEEVNGAGIYVNGQNKDIENAPVINIHDSAELSGLGQGLYAAGYAIWNINGANIYGKESGLAIKSGKFNIVNANISTDGEKNIGSYNGDGINKTGSAIQIETNKDYAGEININITNGTYESKNGNVIYHYYANKDGSTNNNSLKEIEINGGTFKGTISLISNDNLVVNNGNFTTDVSQYIKNGGKVVNNNYYYVVNNIYFNIIENSTASSYISKNKVIGANEGDLISLDISPIDGYYVKNVSVTKYDDESVIVNVKNNQFTMPNYAVNVNYVVAKFEEKVDNIVLIPSQIKTATDVDDKILKEIEKFNENIVKNNILDAIDNSKLNINNNSLVEVKLQTTLTDFDGIKNTMSFDIKPIYYINGELVGNVPNSAIKSTIKVKVPVPSAITDTHAKVIHLGSSGEVLDEKTYSIKEQNGNKYIEIETNSFSTFSISFLTIDDNSSVSDNVSSTEIIDNPKTIDKITIFAITFLLSLMMFTISYTILKNRVYKKLK